MGEPGYSVGGAKVGTDRIEPCFSEEGEVKEDHAHDIVILRVRSGDTAVQMWEKSTAMQWHRAGNSCCCCLDVLYGSSFHFQKLGFCTLWWCGFGLVLGFGFFFYSF